MIYEFKSRATGSIVMTEPVGQRVLEIIGKEPGPRGIITVDQIPGAIAALRKAVDDEALMRIERAQQATAGGGAFGEHSPGEGRSTNPVDRDGDEEDDDDTRAHPHVSLAQRVFPFVEMLEAAHQAGKDVTWGV